MKLPMFLSAGLAPAVAFQGEVGAVVELPRSLGDLVPVPLMLKKQRPGLRRASCLVDLSRAPLCVDPQFWRFQRSNVIKYVGNSLLVFSCCAVTPGCSDFVRFLFFSTDCRSSLVSLPMLLSADFASGLPKEGWIPADSAEPEVLGLLPAHLSCLSAGLSTFWSLSPKAFVPSSALGISLF